MLFAWCRVTLRNNANIIKLRYVKEIFFDERIYLTRCRVYMQYIKRREFYIFEKLILNIICFMLILFEMWIMGR